jgi:hypothetical protein
MESTWHDATERLRKLGSEELANVNCSTNVVRVKRVRCVACIKEMKNVYKILFSKSEGTYRFEDMALI